MKPATRIDDDSADSDRVLRFMLRAIVGISVAISLVAAFIGVPTDIATGLASAAYFGFLLFRQTAWGPRRIAFLCAIGALAFFTYAMVVGQGLHDIILVA